MTIEKIKLSPEDKAFAETMAKLRKEPVDEILFWLSDPSLRPSFLDKAKEEIEAVLSLGQELFKTQRGIHADYNENKKFNTEDAQEKAKKAEVERMNMKLMDELAWATTRKRADIEKFWNDDTTINILLHEVLVNMKEEGVDPGGIEAVFSLLSKNPRFHRALQENQNLADAWAPFASRFPLNGIEPTSEYTNQD